MSVDTLLSRLEGVPRPGPLGARAIAFVSGEVEAFIAARIAERDGANVTAEQALTPERPARPEPHRGSQRPSGKSR